jgi:aspartyl-tRNA(Asn)/glutamyl-tRNA(Gln) amidotransferase subunit A
MDLPAVSLPTGTPSCGIMLCGHTGQDDRLLRVAAQAEAALQR